MIIKNNCLYIVLIYFIYFIFEHITMASFTCMGITCIIECVHVCIYYDCPFTCMSITCVVECVQVDKYIMIVLLHVPVVHVW